MNHAVISKEALLTHAMKIVEDEGIEKLSIRYLASKCDVAVGSIYNYFPSKSDLLIAVTTEFWKSAFHPSLWELSSDRSFADFFEKIYLQLGESLSGFKITLLRQLSSMSASDREKGRAVEQGYFAHMQQGLLLLLDNDSRIPPSVWTDSFTKEQFISFIFSSTLSSLMQGERSCEYLKEIINRILYK